MLPALEKDGCDLLLLDIDMPEMNGMEIAKCLTDLLQKPLLVFVTSHDELVYDSLLYHPFGFIRKAYLEQELEKILSDCKREIASREKCAGRQRLCADSQRLSGKSESSKYSWG